MANSKPTTNGSSPTHRVNGKDHLDSSPTSSSSKCASSSSSSNSNQSVEQNVYDRFATPEPPAPPVVTPSNKPPKEPELSLDSISISSTKSRSTHSKPQAPPPPSKTSPPPVTSEQKSVARSAESPSKSSILSEQIELLSLALFEDICEEVIKCDDRAPSVPDVILQVISELLGESAAAAAAATSSTTSIETSPACHPQPNKVETNSGINITKVLVESPPLVPKDTPVRQDSKKSLNGVASVMSSSASFEKSPKAAVARIISNYSITSALDMPKSSSSSSIASNSPRLLNQAKTSSAGDSNGKEEKPTATPSAAAVSASQQKLNRNRTRKTITKTFVIDGQTQTIQKIINTDDEERQKKVAEERKRDLIEHRRNLNEDRRKLVDLTRKQDAEKEGLEADFKEQRDKLLREFEIKLAQIYSMRKAEIERCEEAQTNELKSTLKRIKSEQERALKTYREQLKDEFKMFKKELDLAANGVNQHQMIMSKEHKDILKKQKEKELVKRVKTFD
jgi:hypothetical protein